MFSLGLSSVPKSFGQAETVKVLSYSWYVDFIGYFGAVGEFQNTGSETIDKVCLSGIAYAPDGTPQDQSYTRVWLTHLVPQQKAPFYMEFPEYTSWMYLGIDRVDFKVIQGNATTS